MKLARTLLFLLTVSPAALAGGLEPRHVPADARWVAHVDLEAVDRSKFLRALAGQGEDFTREFDLDRVKTTFGVDPRKDLTALTFFNSSTVDRDFVVLVEARPSIDVMWSRITEHSKDVRLVGTRNVYGIGTSLNLLATRAKDARFDSRLFVLATSEAGMAAALVVLDGEAPYLSAANASTITARPSSGSIVFAAGAMKSRNSPFMGAALNLLREFAGLERPESNHVELNTQGLVFELSEEQNDMCLRLELDTPAAKNAGEVAQVFRGALARVTKLAAGTDAVPQIERLTGAMKIETQMARVKANFRYDAVGFVSDVMRSEKMMGVTKAR